MRFRYVGNDSTSPLMSMLAVNQHLGKLHSELTSLSKNDVMFPDFNAQILLKKCYEICSTLAKRSTTLAPFFTLPEAAPPPFQDSAKTQSYSLEITNSSGPSLPRSELASRYITKQVSTATKEGRAQSCLFYISSSALYPYQHVTGT